MNYEGFTQAPPSTLTEACEILREAEMTFKQVQGEIARCEIEDISFDRGILDNLLREFEQAFVAVIEARNGVVEAARRAVKP